MNDGDMMMKKHAKKRGVAQAIIVFILILVLVGAIFIPLNLAVSQFNQLQSSGILGGFDNDSLSFVQTLWLWLPAIVVFASITYVYMKAQKRNMGE
jgi:cbb3-type cytochrome oxidase subunit 3